MLIREDYFKNIFNTVHEGILILDENMRVLSANRGFFNIFKVNTANTIGSLLYDLGDGQWNIPDLRVLLEDILPKNTSVDNFEIEHHFQSIGHKIMLLNACKIPEKNNDPPIILLAIEDITERKRLQDLLTESEERYRRIFETASDGIVLLEKHEGNIIHANPAAEKMLGYSEEEYVGKNLQDIGVSLDMSDFSAIMQALNKSGIINYEDVPVQTKSGQHIYTDIYMVDRARVAQCNIREITERKRAEEEIRRRVEELKKSEERFRLLVANAKDYAIFMLDQEGRVETWNAGAEHLKGYKAEEIIGENFSRFYTPEDIAGNTPEKELKTAREIGQAEEEGWRVRKDGSLFWASVLITALRDDNGMLRGFAKITRDITERKKSEESLRQHTAELEKVNEELESIIYAISHDLRGPLRAIFGFSEITMKDIIDKLDDKEKGYLYRIHDGAEKMSRLIDDLLALAKISRQEIQQKLIDLSGMAASIIADLRETDPSRSVKVDIREGLTAFADRELIEIVLLNLLGNAWKFTAKTEHARIEFGTVEQDGKIIYYVRDNGAGFDQKYVGKMFRPFHRLHSEAAFEGTGIGLAIVDRIVNLHGGKVWAEGVEGNGATIYFSLT